MLCFQEKCGKSPLQCTEKTHSVRVAPLQGQTFHRYELIKSSRDEHDLKFTKEKEDLVLNGELKEKENSLKEQVRVAQHFALQFNGLVKGTSLNTSTTSTFLIRSQPLLSNDKCIMMQYTNWINSTPSQQ